jgi:hypothetical protein
LHTSLLTRAVYFLHRLHTSLLIRTVYFLLIPLHFINKSCLLSTPLAFINKSCLLSTPLAYLFIHKSLLRST